MTHPPTLPNGFSADQVGNLAFNQTQGPIHPFTCPNRGDGSHRKAYGDLGALVATTRGWICPFCDYTQDWAHDFMANTKLKPVFGSAPTPGDDVLKQLAEGK